MASTQHEPTMEEILASIRKIISEDSTEAPAAPATAPAAAAAAPAAVPEPEVLELTQEVEEEVVVAEPEPLRPAPVEAKADDIVFETIEEAPVAHQAQSHGDIFSDNTRKALDEAFAGLDEEGDDRPAYSSAPIAPIDGANVEAVFERAVRESFDPVLRQWLDGNAEAVVERMKPIIREWMDEHFPALLEGAVRNEVARVVQARGKKR